MLPTHPLSLKSRQRFIQGKDLSVSGRRADRAAKQGCDTEQDWARGARLKHEVFIPQGFHFLGQNQHLFPFSTA